MTDTNTDDAKATWYRNDPVATFDAHLFEGEDVAAAGVENGGQSYAPVASLCSRTTSHGPFVPVGDDEVAARAGVEHETDMCDVCLSTVARDDEDEADEVDA